MSLKEELMKLADKLVDAVQTADDANQWLGIVMLHAAELRGISKGMPERDLDVSGLTLHNPTAEDMKLKSRLAALDAGRAARLQEADSVVMRSCVGGPADAVTVATHPDMGEGNYCNVAGARYQLRGGELHYSP